MHDANIRVAIAGAGGRMGRQLIQAALALEGVQLGAALEREGSSLLGSDAGELAGERPHVCHGRRLFSVHFPCAGREG